MIAYSFLVIDGGYHIRGVLQMQWIPDVAFLIEGAAHLLKLIPFHVAHLASLYWAPPFAIAVNGAFARYGNVLALAGVDGWSCSVFLLSCLLICLDEVVLILREYDDGILLQMQVYVVLERDESCQIDAGWHIEVTATHLAQFANGFGKGLSVHRLSIAIAAAFQDAYLIVGDGRQDGLSHLNWQVLIILVVFAACLCSGHYGEECQ